MSEGTNFPAVKGSACDTCPIYNAANLKKLGVSMDDSDHVVALAGNPNTGKSTVFNGLTGLRQHTGNWPGKTVTRAEGGFEYGGQRYKIVDLPGTYSLLSTSTDEEVARDFILFGQPDATVVVVDASCLERNLNLVIQVLEITDRVVVCLNLLDEAKRREITVDERGLARDLGVPVVPTVARRGQGLPDLLEAIKDVVTGRTALKPHRIESGHPTLKRAMASLQQELEAAFPRLPNARWVALRLLAGDERIIEAVQKGELGKLGRSSGPELAASAASIPAARENILSHAQSLRWDIGADFHDRLVEAIYTDAARIADRAVTRPGDKQRFDLDRTIDGIVTSRIWGFPVMLLLLASVFWITIVGANVPSGWISILLIDTIYPALREGAAAVGVPWWIRGLVIDGMYLATAWVVSVMLPPMAIFFPIFTLLEDFGYLPRVAFNLDNLFKKSGAHGKQALTMAMGYGCNAAGVVATRIIDSPRERLIAIITNNFALCNGRWPTQILIASLFIGALAPSYLAGFASALAVLAVTLLGVLLTFAVSWFLSRTMLRGEVSRFSLELPPYRPPRILQTIYTSLIDRTIYVLWRAVIFALPAGAVIWLIANVSVGGTNIAQHLMAFLSPLGVLVGLNGVILLAYIVAIPANEIVIPTILMLTVLATGQTSIGEGAGVIFEMESKQEILKLLTAGGWTLLTAVNLMLFSLVHNPCSTTIYTIYRETKSARWTLVAALLPVLMGFVLTFFVAQVWRLAAGA
jgi:ferrous iron transport protein B